jgi:hypothetical protein
LYNILIEFGIPKKLVRLIKMFTFVYTIFRCVSISLLKCGFVRQNTTLYFTVLYYFVFCSYMFRPLSAIFRLPWRWCAYLIHIFTYIYTILKPRFLMRDLSLLSMCISVMLDLNVPRVDCCPSFASVHRSLCSPCLFVSLFCF